MNSGIGLSPVSVFTAFAALDGGKAPAGWRRDIEEKLAALEALRRGGGWIEELAAVHPRLFEGPLHGPTLEALTGFAVPQQEAQPRALRPRMAKSSLGGHSLESKWDKAIAGGRAVSASPTAGQAHSVTTKGKAPTDDSTQALLQLRKQADRSLLSRLCRHREAFEATEQRRSMRFGAFDKSSANPLPTTYGDTAVRSDWLNRTARRAGKNLPWGRPHAAGTAKHFQSEAPSNEKVPFPAAQGEIPLDATEVPSELPIRRVKENRPGREENKEMAQRAAGASRSAERDAVGTVKATRSEMQGHGEVAALAEQWRVPLDGLCASSELLDRLVQEGRLSDMDNNGAITRRVSRSQPRSSSGQGRRPSPVERAEASSSRNSRSQLGSACEHARGLHSAEQIGPFSHRSSGGQPESLFEETDFSQPSWRPDGSTEPPGRRIGSRDESGSSSNGLETMATTPVVTQVGARFFAPEAGAGGPARDDEGKMESLASGIPPTVTPPLPPLLSPQSAGAPSLPEAAVTARLAAREKESVATDDLDVLATKIKQILDEEARRHGIDV